MYEKVSDEELVLADKLTNDIADNIQKYFMESVNPKYTQFCKVVVLVPLTENLNEEFMIDVPKEMMDEDNSTLLEYFVNHIYKPEDKYMTESINTIIAERDAATLRLEENLKNFDPEAFSEECDEDFVMRLFGINPDPPCPINKTFHSDFDGDILEMSDILSMLTEDDDDEYLVELAASRVYPFLRERNESGLKFTDEELELIRKIDTGKVGIPNNPLEITVTGKTKFLPHAIERSEQREISPDAASINDIIQASVIMFEQSKRDESDDYFPYLFVGPVDAVVIGVTKRGKLEADAVITLWNYRELKSLSPKDMQSKKNLDKILVEVVKCIPAKKEQN